MLAEELVVAMEKRGEIADHSKHHLDVYVLQGETKTIPNGYHWDVTDPRHLLMVAPILQDQSALSLESLKALLGK